MVGDINSRWESWKNCFLQVVDLSIPHTTTTPNRRLPWINHSIIQAIRKRKVLYDIYKCTQAETDLIRYKAQRNLVVSLLRESKEEYFLSLHDSDAKDFWKAIRKLSTNQSSIPTLKDGDTLADTSQDKAILLNKFFFSCFNRRCPPLSFSSVASGCPDNEPELVPEAFPRNLLCTEDSIAELLVSLDPSKSSGVDGISARMLRLSAYSISSSLTKLFNFSLTTGSYPKE